MSTHADHPLLADYARRLRWALASLPEADRNGIVDEMRSHVLDRTDAGMSIEASLGALGGPEDYARAFCESYAVAAALSSRRTPHLVSALVQGAARNLAAAGAGFVILLAWSLAALVVFVAILKIDDPAHVGLWLGDRFFFLGIIDDPSAGRELLGPWIAPFALVCVVLSWIATRSLAAWALKRLTTKR